MGNRAATGRDEDGQRLEAGALREAMRHPATMIRRAQQICTAIFVEECGEENLTPLQYGALWTLTLSTGLTQAMIGRAMAVDRTTTAMVLRNLEKRGLVQRRLRATDRRVKYVFITPSGRRVVERLTGRVEKARERIVSPLNATERAIFARLLAKIIDGYGETQPLGDQDP